MKKKLIAIFMFSIIILSFVGCSKDQVEDLNSTLKNDTEVVTIKDSGYEGYEYEVDVRNKVKELLQTSTASFAITDKINLFITVEGDRAVLNANKQKAIDYLKKDTKYNTVTLIMHDSGSSVLNAFYNEKVK